VRMRTRWVGGIAAVVVMVGLAGCGGEDPETDRGGDVPTEPAKPTEDEVESDLPEGVPTAPPERPSPEEETLESAEAFGQYVLEVWWYTALGIDTSAMEELSAFSQESSEYACTFCEGAIDAANILKPPLSRGELQCIGATTLDEYRKYIEKDAALERRFQPVMVEEPTLEQTVDIDVTASEQLAGEAQVLASRQPGVEVLLHPQGSRARRRLRARSCLRLATVMR
jgi:hypothetical protein